LPLHQGYLCAFDAEEDVLRAAVEVVVDDVRDGVWEREVEEEIVFEVDFGEA
jgi:hypothetical protein